MHTCKAPIKALEKWLTPNQSDHGNYGHLLLEQTGDNDDELLAALRPYFESAHLDARTHFHEQIGIDLHPDAVVGSVPVAYPASLPTTAIRGLFGEVLAGLVTEAYPLIGEHDWRLPIFLFRYHADAETYLFTLARDTARVRTVFGRFGADFVAIVLDGSNEVVRYLTGEAKWRQRLTQAVVDELLEGAYAKPKSAKKTTSKPSGKKKRDGKGIWGDLNRNVDIPHGLRQLNKLLKESDPEAWQATILSLDKVLTVVGGTTIPRTNLVLISGVDSGTRKGGECFVEFDAVPAGYKAPHDLQVVELLLNDGSEDMIDLIYASLWSEE